MKTCGCGATFTTTLAHTKCWECRLIGDPYPRLTTATAIPPLTSWQGWGTAGIGTTM